MKLSKYNIIVPYKTAAIIYNSLWDSCIMFANGNNVIKMLQNIETLCSDDILKTFIANKFIIEDDIDELHLIEQYLSKTNNNYYNYIITINPTLSCNFNCWYCYENHQNKPFMSDVDIQNISSFISNIFAKEYVKNVQLNFFGGEPLLGFNKIVKKIIETTEATAKKYSKTYNVCLTSNAYLLNKEICNYLFNHSIASIQITLDGNKKRHDTVRHLANGTGSYNTIIKNVKYALSLGIDIFLRLNISEETMLDVELLLQDFLYIPDVQKKHLFFSVQKVWQAEKAVFQDISNIVTSIRQSGFKCNEYNMSYHTIHSTCYADKTHHIIINPNGEIYGCTAIDFNESTCEGTMHDGHVIFNSKRNDRITCSPTEIEECRNCYLLPICIGGCKTKILEAKKTGKSICGFSEKEKQDFATQYVLDRFNN